MPDEFVHQAFFVLNKYKVSILKSGILTPSYCGKHSAHRHHLQSVLLVC
jgi:hypothetical protein